MKIIRETLLGLYINLLMIILLLASAFRGLLKNNMGNWIQWLLIAAVVVSGIFNILFGIKNIYNTWRLYKNNEYNSLRKYMKRLKLGAVPYFILNFVLYFFLFTLFFAASRGIFIFTPIPLFFLVPIFFTYLSVLLTSCYGIGFAAILNKEKNLGSGKMIIHVLLQICFVLDVLSTIILIIKYKYEPK